MNQASAHHRLLAGRGSRRQAPLLLQRLVLPAVGLQVPQQLCILQYQPIHLLRQDKRLVLLESNTNLTSGSSSRAGWPRMLWSDRQLP